MALVGLDASIGATRAHLRQNGFARPACPVEGTARFLKSDARSRSTALWAVGSSGSIDGGGRLRGSNAIAEKQEQGKSRQLILHAEHGGKLNISLEEHETHYSVKVEANFPDSQLVAAPLYLHWGLFRSDSSDWVLLEPDEAPSGTKFVSGMDDEAMQTPLRKVSPCTQYLEFDISSGMVPFYIGFVLHKPASEDHEALWIKRKCGSTFCIPVGIHTGRPDPLGFTLLPDGSANFALFSTNATHVSLCLYSAEDPEPTMEVGLHSSLHRTGDIWHVQLENIDNFVRYGFRCKGEATWDNGDRFFGRHVLLDPYARFIAPSVPEQEDLPSPSRALGWLTDGLPFDWEEDVHPCIPMERIVAYRLNVEAFTKCASSGIAEDRRGTFLGLCEKIPHLKMLGVNAVILQPIFAFDQGQGSLFHVSYFSPSELYASEKCSLGASVGLKSLVKCFHGNGIEVMLDVFYSHTAENGDDDPRIISFRGIDNVTYYVLDTNRRVLKSKSGAANIFNCNHPTVHKVVLDSLRYWVQEYHVDGFCFGDAFDLLKGPHGQDLSRPLLVEAIAFDPLLSNTKLIADFSSVSTSSCPKFPHWTRWSECRTDFQDSIRRFFRGDKGLLSQLASMLCGSVRESDTRRLSINYVANAYGLTLADVVSYRETDAPEARQFSWDAGSHQTRAKQIRNMLVTLFLSRGVPLLNMADEYGHSNGGVLRKDSCTQFDWTRLQESESSELCKFISSLVSFREAYHNFLQRRDMAEIQLHWHGVQADKELQWENADSCFLAVSLRSTTRGLYLAFNAHEDAMEIMLPVPPEGTTWFRIGDTSLAHPNDFNLHSTVSLGNAYRVDASSVVVLEARTL